MSRLGIKSLLDNPTIAPLVDIKRWTIVNEQPIDKDTITQSNGTISSAFEFTKVPVDARYLIDENKLRGAWATDEQCLISLKELHNRIPNAANACFYLRAQVDGYMIIDVEPECPPEEKARLLSIPGILYGEASLSGRGYHLLVPLPKNFYDFPAATSKRALKNGPMHWEILLDHWVTFTTKPAVWPFGHGPVTNPPTIEDLWEELASHAKETPKVEMMTLDDRPEIACETKILEMLAQAEYPKSITDFDGDYSRYEFGMASFIYHRIEALILSMVRQRLALMEDYGDTEIAWLVYMGLTQALEHRPKHDQTRGGYPWLMYQTLQVMARFSAEKQTQQN